MNDEVVSQLQTMNSLLRALLTVNLEALDLKRADKIWLLYNSGLAIGEIAGILRITPNNIAVTLHSLRKSRGTQSGAKGEKKD